MVAPTLTSVNIKSNNLNEVIAGITDSVTITFTANEPITVTSVIIDGNISDSIINTTGNTWLATRKMKRGDFPAAIIFTIAFSNLTAEAGIPVSTTTDNSLVTYNDLTNTIPKFADINRIYQDIEKIQGENVARDNLVTRAAEDSGTELEAIFLNLVDFDLLNDNPWFVDLATQLATTMYWKKSNGTEAQIQMVKDALDKSQRIKVERFFPQEYR